MKKFTRPETLALVSLLCGLYPLSLLIIYMILSDTVSTSPQLLAVLDRIPDRISSGIGNLLQYSFALALFLQFVLLLIVKTATANLPAEPPDDRIRRRRCRMSLICVGLTFLGGIALPNFMHASTPTHVMRRHMDLRIIGKALEAYQVDHHAYPTSLQTLTTPVTYLHHDYRDRGSWDNHAYGFRAYGYRAVGQGAHSGWIIFGAGTDGTYQLNMQDIDKVYHGEDLQPSPGLLTLGYDPTNGSTSAGDIWFTSQGFSSPMPKW